MRIGKRARRLEGRRLPVLPAARPRVGDAADVPGDRRAAAAQLRDRPADRRTSSTTSTSSSCRRPTRTARTTRCTTSASSGKNMTNHCVVGGKETDDPFAANFWHAAGQPSAAPRRTRRSTPRRATRGASTSTATTRSGRCSTATSARRLVHQRGLRRPGRGVRAGDQERALDRGHVRRTSSSRTTSTASAATSCGRRARTCPTAARVTSCTRTSAWRSTSSPRATRSSTASRRSATRRSCRSGRARSRTSCTRPPATAPTSTGTTAT